jgi:hypothetical protein
MCLHLLGVVCQFSFIAGVKLVAILLPVAAGGLKPLALE